MPHWAIALYIEALPALLAEQQLSAIEAASFAHIKKGVRQRIARRLERIARKFDKRPEAKTGPRTVEELQQVMGPMGFNVVVEDGKKDA
jgi:hypothetical protein